jgi:subtilisin family serine protease
MKHLAMAALLPLLTAACVMHPPLPAVPTERQVLVILDDEEAGHVLPAGSKRGYRGDAQWPVSLHARSDARRLARDHGLRELHAWPVAELALFCVVFQVPDSVSRQALIGRLDADSRVKRAQPVNEFQGMLSDRYDDPLFDVQYGEHKQVLESVHALTTGAGIRIGIVDGHVDSTHADLRGQIAHQFPPGKDTDLDGLRHGTAVAGVIAAAAGNGEGVVGLAPDATVSVYAACRHTSDRVTRCTTVSLAEAVEQAVADASDVINLSIAGPDDWLLERLLRHAHERGAMLVAAHNQQDPQRSFPGSLPFVHAAGPDARPWFARQEQFSTRAGGGYQMFFGSSMSAAGVTGIAALLRTQWPGPETEAALDQLLRSGCLITEDTELLRIITAHEGCSP